MKKLLLIASFSLLLSSCHVENILSYKIPDINDQYYFDKIDIDCSDNPSFIPKDTISIPPLPEEYHRILYNNTLESFLTQKNTLSFLILRNDTLIFERYYYDTIQYAVTPVFSISKSIISSLVGIALEEGDLKSINDPITYYIPELGGKYSDITLQMLLDMRSGLDCHGFINGVPKIYFSKDLKKVLFDYYLEHKPGTYYEYENVNTLLLTMALENATSTNTADYLETKIWKPLGMSNQATWNIDDTGQIKGFTGLNAAPIDLIRFGNLILNNGMHNGKQLIPFNWITQCMTVHNDSKDDDGYNYSYSWRLTEKGNYAAVGMLGQYIFVEPSKNIVIVRTGEALSYFDWIEFFETLSEDL